MIVLNCENWRSGAVRRPWPFSLEGGGVRALQEGRLGGSLLVHARLQGKGGAAYAALARPPMQPPRLSKARPAREQVLRGACFPPPGGEPLRCLPRLHQPMAEGVQGLPSRPPSLRRVREARQVREGDGGGSHHAPPRRSGAFLESGKLATAVQILSRQKDRHGRPDAFLSLLTL